MELGRPIQHVPFNYLMDESVPPSSSNQKGDPESLQPECQSYVDKVADDLLEHCGLRSQYLTHPHRIPTTLYLRFLRNTMDDYNPDCGLVIENMDMYSACPAGFYQIKIEDKWYFRNEVIDLFELDIRKHVKAAWKGSLKLHGKSSLDILEALKQIMDCGGLDACPEEELQKVLCDYDIFYDDTPRLFNDDPGSHGPFGILLKRWKDKTMRKKSYQDYCEVQGKLYQNASQKPKFHWTMIILLALMLIL